MEGLFVIRWFFFHCFWCGAGTFSSHGNPNNGENIMLKKAPQRRKERKDSIFENNLSKKVIGAAIEVHKFLGPGLLESTYEKCLCRELELKGLCFEPQKSLPVKYKGIMISTGYRLDLVVENSIIIELKSVEKILPIHEAQLLTYLKLTGLKLGLIINFNVPVLKEGLKRIVNKL